MQDASTVHYAHMINVINTKEIKLDKIYSLTRVDKDKFTVTITYNNEVVREESYKLKIGDSIDLVSSLNMKMSY